VKRRSFKYFVGPGLATLGLAVSVLNFTPAAFPADERFAAAAAAANPPQHAQAFASPTHLDPTTLPVISGSASPSEQAELTESAGPAAPGHYRPVMSPDNAAREAAQQGKGPKGPDNVDRAQIAAPGRALASANPPTANVPVVNLNFNGLQQCQGDAQFCWNPPDQALSVGVAHVLEANNEKLEGFTHAGGTVLGPVSLQAWFGRPSNVSIFDPVALYRGGHHYLVALEQTGSASTIWLSVSVGDSVTGGWCNYGLNGKVGNSWSDFPKVGVTVGNNSANSRLLIATNLFDLSTGSFTNNFLQELPKAALDSCSGFSYSTWTNFTDANDNSIAFTLVPLVDYDNGSGDGGWQLETARFGSGGGITLWRNVFGTGFQRFLIDTIDYSNPPGATQPGTSVRIDTIDDRLQSAVKRFNKTWSMHTSRLGGCGSGNDTAVVHTFDIFTPMNGVTTPTVVSVSGSQFSGAGTRDFLIAGACGTHQFNAAGSNDRDGNFLFTYSESGDSEYDSPRFGGYHLERGLIFGGFIGAPNPGFINTTGRHGDYAAAVGDPTDNRFVYVANQTEISNNFWGTRIGRLNNGNAGSEAWP